MYYDIFILGTLLEGPHYGYEIKKELIEGFSICSSISNNTLYPILKKFQAAGATRKTVEAVEGKPSRIIYHITDEGRRLFVDQLRNFPDTLLLNRDDFFMRIMYFHYLDRPARVRVLDGRQAILKRSLEQLTARHVDGSYADTAAFHRGLLQSESDLIEKFRARLDSPCLMTPEGVVTV